MLFPKNSYLLCDILGLSLAIADTHQVKNDRKRLIKRVCHNKLRTRYILFLRCLVFRRSSPGKSSETEPSQGVQMNRTGNDVNNEYSEITETNFGTLFCLVSYAVYSTEHK